MLIRFFSEAILGLLPPNPLTNVCPSLHLCCWKLEQNTICCKNSASQTVLVEAKGWSMFGVRSSVTTEVVKMAIRSEMAIRCYSLLG